MDEQEHAGKRKRHELTGLEIKLLYPNPNGWRVKCFTSSMEEYIVNMTNEDLAKRYRDVVEE